MKSDILCGLAAVRAVFDRRPEAVQRLLYTEALRHEVGDWCARLATARKPYRLVPPDELARAAATEHHGGIVAVASARVPAILDLAQAPPAIAPRHDGDVLLLLDGIANPYNLGAIARSAAFFGALGLVLHELPGAALPSTAAHRTAEGGLEYLQLWRTRDLPAALTTLAPLWRLVAAVAEPDATPLDGLPRDRPIALILGHEERGIGAAVLAATRRRVRIAGRGRVHSLNVAHSATVLLHALLGG